MRLMKAGLCVFLILGSLMLTACGGYTLRGRAVRGDFGMITNVDKNDARLLEPGIANARVDLHRDPQSLGSELVATGYSMGDGTLEFPVSAFGAGWMDEVWRVVVHREGYQPQEAIMSLPSGSQRLLIVMPEGRGGRYRKPESLWDQYEQYR